MGSVGMRCVLQCAVIVLLTWTAVRSGAVYEREPFQLDEASTWGMTSHTVNDVAPAVKNATAVALARADEILTKYSDSLRIASIPCGLIVTFLGSFLVTPVLFVAGFLSGGGVSFIAMKAVIGADTPAAAWISIAAMVLGGLIIAFVTLRLLTVGMFALGAMMGYMVAAALTPSVLTRIYPKDSNVGFYAGAIVLGIFFGAVAIRKKRQMMIVCTAYGGAFAFFFGVGYFAGHFPTSAELSKAEKGHFGVWFIVYSILTIIFGSIGAFVQFRMTGRRPFVHAGRVDQSHNGRNGWWGRRNDAVDLTPEEMDNLPQNEGGKRRLEKEFVAVREVDSDSGESHLHNYRFSNSTGERNVNQIHTAQSPAVTRITLADKQRATVDVNSDTNGLVDNKNIVGDTRITVG